MAIDFQAKLLRVIQEREYYRVGGVKKQKANVRFICATNQDIKARVADGTFREDLYFRLNIGHIVIPPLRERTEEIVPLARLFLAQISEKKNTRFKSISDSACQRLLDYSWPGNVRELKNTIERIVILNDDTEIKPKHLEVLFTENLKVYNSRNNSNNMNDNNDNDIDPIVDIDNIELPDNGIELHGHTLDIVKKALEKHQYNKTKTAKFLGLTRNELYTYLKKIET
jgi:DNA-binding NtrC family response regulator